MKIERKFFGGDPFLVSQRVSPIVKVNPTTKITEIWRVELIFKITRQSVTLKHCSESEARELRKARLHFEAKENQASNTSFFFNGFDQSLR